MGNVLVFFPFFYILTLGIYSRKLSKEYILTGDTASPLSTTTTYSWLASSLYCCLLFCTCWDSGTSIGARPTTTPPPLCHGWKQASAHPHSRSTSKLCTAASTSDIYSVSCPPRLICLVGQLLCWEQSWHTWEQRWRWVLEQNQTRRESHTRTSNKINAWPSKIYIQPKEIKGTIYFIIFRHCFKVCDLRWIMQNKHFENALRIQFFFTGFNLIQQPVFD